MTNQESAKKHTAIIGSTLDMWSKLAWDVDVFQDIQRSYPREKQPLAYAAINVCIAAVSLRDWAKAAVEERAGDAWNENAFYEDLRDAVPELIACEAIANTSKHSDFREQRWLSGFVELTWDDGDEDFPSGYTLYHVTSSEMQSVGIAFSRFTSLKDNWWKYLVGHGLGHVDKLDSQKPHNVIQGHFYGGFLGPIVDGRRGMGVF
jgi:hypothetical protein